MKYQQIALMILSVFVLTFGFSNCGKFEVADGQAQVSSQCLAKLRNDNSIIPSASACEDMTSFECERREFRPGVGGEPSTDFECVSIRPGSEVCVAVHVFRFNTEAARSGAEPSAFEEGGEYNRDEVQCVNTKIKRQNMTVIQASDSTVESALKAVVDKCRDGAEI